MNLFQNKLMVYDGNCVVCTNLADALVKWNFVPQQQITPYVFIPENLQKSVDLERFKNEMALIDQKTLEVKYGVEAILMVLSQKVGLFKWFLEIPFLKTIANFFYKIVAFNRLIIYPPNSKGFVCDCEPDFNGFYRSVYFSFIVLIAVFLTWNFGESLTSYFPQLDSNQLAINTLLVCSTGWVLQSLTALFLLSFQKAATYIGNLGSIMFIGLGILIPTILWDSLTNWHFVGLPILSVMVSFGVMLYQHHIRALYQQLPKSWMVSWVAFLIIGAIGWVLALGVI